MSEKAPITPSGSRWRRLAELFRRSVPTARSRTELIDPTAQTTGRTEAQDTTRTQQILKELDQQSRSTWIDRKVPLEAVNIRRTLPINWSAIVEASRVVNKNKRTQLTKDHVAALKPSPEVYPFVPMAASVLAHQKNKHIPERLPTEAEIKKMKLWLNDVVFFVGLFSKDWAEKLNRTIEKEGANIIRLAVLKVGKAIDSLGRFENPQQQFIQDIYTLYSHLAQPAYKDGWFGPEEVSIEDKIHSLLDSFAYISDKHYVEGVDPWSWHWFNKANLPLLEGLAPIVGFPPASLDRGTASIAGAELMSGLESFLRSHNLEVPPAPQATPFDPFNLATYWRALAEWWDPDRLEQVKQDIPQILDFSIKALPSSGADFSQKAFQIAENIVILDQQGVPPKKVVENIFKK